MCNPLADFGRETRAGVEALASRDAPGGRRCLGGGATSASTSAEREKLVAVDGAQLYRFEQEIVDPATCSD